MALPYEMVDGRQKCLAVTLLVWNYSKKDTFYRFKEGGLGHDAANMLGQLTIWMGYYVDLHADAIAE